MEYFPSHIPSDLAKLDNFIANQESQYNLKKGTNAQIIWQNSTRRVTDKAIVYLHGFRASHPEGHPVHKTIAREFGYNLFLSRTKEHGINSDYPLLHLTEKKMLESAKFALEVGRRLGNKVILMGTSTGASLALYLASKAKYQQHISSLVLYSPLIDFHGISSGLLTNRWSRKLLSIVPGKKYLIKSKKSTYAEDKIWNKEYALAGALQLGAFVQHHMTPSLFRKVTHPVFVGYYYKNIDEQDTVISVNAIKKMVDFLGTRTNKLTISNFPDAKNHVICSSLLSKSVDSVIDNTRKFLKRIDSHTHS
ncbi:alpha/beta hydrolase [Fodinibius sp. Rm-B-1B1-1]|uniref:alpha/beta hydrolase n=1 Tax=Fodinibius alkaliphilus TaxID=3140241 RepID=UPI00315A81CF